MAHPPANPPGGPAESTPSPPTGTPQPGLAGEVLRQVRAVGWLVTALSIITVTLPGINGMVLMYYATSVRDWVQSHAGAAYIVFPLAMALGTGFALLPTYALSFASGVFFGPVWGWPIAMLGILGGSCIGYAWGATVARERVMRQIELNPRARIIREALVDRGLGTETLVVGLLRFPPNSPFALTNLVMSAIKVRFAAFFGGTALGMAARTGVAVGLGVAVGSLEKLKEVGGAWAYLGLGAFAVVLFIVYRLFSAWIKAALAKHVGELSPRSA
ncbi:MAG: TVP38/TMEM64 family protein [Phycisphaerales bacterium]|nr:TVP38/TMEM64 family protein [Phycisphaerales bacterium]